MKRTVVQRFDTLGGEESFLKGWLVKGFLDSFSFFFPFSSLFFRKERDDQKVRVLDACQTRHEKERKKILEKLGKVFFFHC